MDIAQAVEEQNCLQAEIDLFSHRCCQFVYAAHSCVLRADKLTTQHEAIHTCVTKSVQGIIDKTRSSPDPSADSKMFYTMFAEHYIILALKATMTVPFRTAIATPIRVEAVHPRYKDNLLRLV